MTPIRVSIMGASGYGGAELIRRLLPDPGIEVLRLSSKDDIGKRANDVHRSLGNLGGDLIIEDLEPEDAARGADVVFLALPHRISMHVTKKLWPTGVHIVDLSGDFRLQDVGTYEKYYKTAHIAPELIKDFVYGMPELSREGFEGARGVASPGCFATAQTLALLPLAHKGWLNGPVSVVAVTGSSGSGIRPGAGTHHPLRCVNLKAYKPLQHQHTPEIEQSLRFGGAGDDLRLDFVPISGPLSRGILVTAIVSLPEGVTDADVNEAYDEAYEGEPFMRVLHDRLPEVAAIKGSQYVEVAAKADGGRAVAICAIDNLVKGGAGQAIQSFNLVMGRPETTALIELPTWP